MPTRTTAELDQILETLAGFGERYRLELGLTPGLDWLPADRLLTPDSGELTSVLEAERVASGHVSAHATALTVMAIYAGTVTASALLAWALRGVVLDMRPANVAIRLSDEHGFAAVAIREPRLVTAADAPEDERLQRLVAWVLDGHLLPIARALHVQTRAGLRQLYGGVAHGCAAAFCIASRTPGADVDMLDSAYAKFLAASTGGLDRLGEVIRIEESDQEALFYLRRTCCLYYTSAEAVKCSSCCLDSVSDRVAAYRRVLADGTLPH